MLSLSKKKTKHFSLALNIKYPSVLLFCLLFSITCSLYRVFFTAFVFVIMLFAALVNYTNRNTISI